MTAAPGLLLAPVASGAPSVDVVHNVDCLTLLKALPDGCINCVVTSPPYFGLRDYGMAGQIGLEPTPQQFVATMVAVFREVRRVLRNDGTAWVNLGDSYSSVGHAKSSSGYGTTGLAGGKAQEHSPLRRENNGTGKHKDMIGIPWRVAFALQDDGWYLRSDIIWHKPNPMPESVTDRPTKSHEYVFLLTKSERYWYDADAIREPTDPNSIARGTRANSDHHKNLAVPGQSLHSLHKTRAHGEGYFVPPMRNARSVWTVPTEPNSFAHFATFPRKLIEPMILAGCPVGGLVLDPFMGSGTTALVARANGRHYIGSELNVDYVAIARERLRQPFEAHYTAPNNDVSALPLFAGLAS